MTQVRLDTKAMSFPPPRDIFAGTNLDVGYPDGCCPIIKSSNFGYDRIVEALVAKVLHFLLIYICNFHVLSDLLIIYIYKLHWNLNTMFVCQVNPF